MLPVYGARSVNSEDGRGRAAAAGRRPATPRPPPPSSRRTSAGVSRCFLTAHWLAARTSASWYFSGKPGGTSMSRPILPTIPVRGSTSMRWTSRMPVGRQVALLAEAEHVDARTRRNRRQEQREWRRRRVVAAAARPAGRSSRHAGQPGRPRGRRQGTSLRCPSNHPPLSSENQISREGSIVKSGGRTADTTE